MVRRLLPELVPSVWGDQKPTPPTKVGPILGGVLSSKAPDPGPARMRHLQSIDDLVNRPVANRVSASTSATAVNLNGAVQSTGIGTGTITPVRYGEVWVQARATFKISAAGALYLFVFRTTGAIPANGAAPNAGDIPVGGDAFAGPATVAGQNLSGTHSFIDSGLNEKQAYRYYFAVQGTNGTVASLVNNSQIQASEF